MTAKRIGIVLAALALLVAVGLVSSHWEAGRQPAICQVCGRVIPQQTEFRMVKADGGSLDACCARCAMHYMVDHPDAVSHAWATDFASGRKIRAQSAYYDEGGDVQYCTRHDPSVERSPEGVRERTYDRCLPTLVAFANREEAESYRQKHGGRVLTYEEALASVRGQ
jgi:hypothetical protein